MKVSVDYAKHQFVFQAPGVVSFFPNVKIDVPFSSIKNILGTNPQTFYRGIKGFGLNFPAYFGTRGTFYCQGQKNYWHTRSDNNVLRVAFCQGFNYGNLYFDAHNPSEVINRMLMTMRNEQASREYYGCESENVEIDIRGEGKIFATLTKPKKNN